MKNSDRRPAESRPLPPEPPVCRWPQPSRAEPPHTEALLRCVCASLSYQNQMLADLRALLERIDLALREEREHDNT